MYMYVYESVSLCLPIPTFHHWCTLILPKPIPTLANYANPSDRYVLSHDPRNTVMDSMVTMPPTDASFRKA